MQLFLEMATDVAVAAGCRCFRLSPVISSVSHSHSSSTRGGSYKAKVSPCRSLGQQGELKEKCLVSKIISDVQSLPVLFYPCLFLAVIIKQCQRGVWVKKHE